VNRSLVRRYTLGGIIKTTYSLFFRHFRKLVGGAIIILAPWQILEWFVSHHLPAGNGTTALRVLSVFALQLATPLVLLHISDVVRGVKPSLRRSLKVYTSDRVWPFAATYIVVALATLLGFLLFIIPGLIASAFFLFATIIATLEGRTVFQSMRKSRMLGKGCYIRNLCVLYASWFAIGLPVMVLYLIVAGALGAASAWLFPTVHEAMLLSLLELVVAILASVIVPAVVLPQILLYYDMRARKEGLDDNRFVEELRLAGFDADHREREGSAWIPARS
jgi:hypothetical protein